MNYKYYSDKQLVVMSNKNKLNNSSLNIEWRRRHHMNYPYKIHESGAILNCVMNAFVGDREMDQLILEQANKQRQRLRRDGRCAG